MFRAKKNYPGAPENICLSCIGICPSKFSYKVRMFKFLTKCDKTALTMNSSSIFYHFIQNHWFVTKIFFYPIFFLLDPKLFFKPICFSTKFFLLHTETFFSTQILFTQFFFTHNLFSTKTFVMVIMVMMVIMMMVMMVMRS